MYSLKKLFLLCSLFFGGINGVIGSNKFLRPNPKLFGFGDSYADTGRYSDGHIATDFLGEINGVESSNNHEVNGLKKLFVFGDSYVDTGNTKMNYGEVPWISPYGITFPGKPSGRYSDGIISTDFLAKLLKIKSPITYFSKDSAGKEQFQYGMNFAYGGTGVFNTMATHPNMTAQISLLESLIDDVYSSSDLSSSLALLSVAGNDYSNYLLQNDSVLGLPIFIKQVVDQIEVDLKRLHTLGVKKIAIHSLHPLGCLPIFSQASSYKNCNEIINLLVGYHNTLMRQVVAKLNTETNSSTFVIFDCYNAFLAAFKSERENPGNQRFNILNLNEKSVYENTRSPRFETPSKPCCEGDCGKVDEKGVKKYTLCDDPKSAFFWDGVHLTQEGWKTVYSILGKNITASLAKA